MQTEWKASLMEAQLKAFDFAGEVWHLWLVSEGMEEVIPGGSAAAGCREKSHVHLRKHRFIVDTGCGHNVITERLNRAAGAMRLIKRLAESIALTIAGGSSRALGSVCVACLNFRDGNFEALVMPETPG
eukprot:6127281-Pyramimonas_sp.AAC.1